MQKMLRLLETCFEIGQRWNSENAVLLLAVSKLPLQGCNWKMQPENLFACQKFSAPESTHTSRGPSMYEALLMACEQIFGLHFPVATLKGQF
jgi:hypothetical protein